MDKVRWRGDLGDIVSACTRVDSIVTRKLSMVMVLGSHSWLFAL